VYFERIKLLFLHKNLVFCSYLILKVFKIYLFIVDFIERI
jgi:hypothetical protein